jgi:hypothetical protein
MGHPLTNHPVPCSPPFFNAPNPNPKRCNDTTTNLLPHAQSMASELRAAQARLADTEARLQGREEALQAAAAKVGAGRASLGLLGRTHDVGSKSSQTQHIQPLCRNFTPLT